MTTRASRTGAFLAGAFIGSLTGAAVALLYAPRSGEETRTVIKEKSIELKDKAVASGEELRHRAEDAAEQARHRIEETAQATRKRAEEMQARGQSFIDEQRGRIKSAIESARKPHEVTEPALAENGVEEPTPAG